MSWCIRLAAIGFVSACGTTTHADPTTSSVAGASDAGTNAAAGKGSATAAGTNAAPDTSSAGRGSGGASEMGTSLSGSTSVPGAGASFGGGNAEPCQLPPSEGRTTFDGDLLIVDDASLAAARKYTDVTGMVRVDPAFVGNVDLPNLISVGSDLAAESAIVSSPAPAIVESHIKRLRAPRLTTVGGQLWIYLNFELTELDVRALTSAASVFIDRNTNLQMVRFDAYPADLSFDAPLADCLAPAFPKVLVTKPERALTCACSSECGHVVADCR